MERWLDLKEEREHCHRYTAKWKEWNGHGATECSNIRPAPSLTFGDLGRWYLLLVNHVTLTLESAAIKNVVPLDQSDRLIKQISKCPMDAPPWQSKFSLIEAVEPSGSAEFEMSTFCKISCLKAPGGRLSVTCGKVREILKLSRP